MANIFTPSGNVIPSLPINFNSNASSNAVRQVFGEATSNMQGLVGSNYNTSTRPPGYTPTLTVPGGNLSLSFFAGKSIFLASPVTLTITTPMTVPSSLTTNVSGGGGTSFYVMVGTTSTGTNILSNVIAGAASVTIASNTNYYISAYGSNAAGASSLLISNASPFVSSVPPTPTGVSFTTTTTAMTPTFTASTGNATTTYRGKIGTTSGGTELGNAVAVTSGSPTTISVASNTFVYVSIAGSNVVGVGTYSSVIGPIASSVPTVPTGLSLTLTSLSNYTGAWTNPAGNALTGVTWSITGTGVNLGPTAASTTGSAALNTGAQTTTLTNGATYTLTVTPTNAKGSTPATVTATAAFARIVSAGSVSGPDFNGNVGSGAIIAGGVNQTSVQFGQTNNCYCYTVNGTGYAVAGSSMHFTFNDAGVNAGARCDVYTPSTSGSAGAYLTSLSYPSSYVYTFSVGTSGTYTFKFILYGSYVYGCSPCYGVAGKITVSMI